MFGKTFVALTRVEEIDSDKNKKDVWFVEKFVGLDIYDISNGFNYEEELKIAKETAEKNNCVLKINN
jgi:hypothetical protein